MDSKAARAIKRLALLFLLAAVGTRAQNVPYSNIVISAAGRPIAGAGISVCNSPGLATTAASVSSNLVTLTMSSNPITAGFAANMTLQVSGFTGADTYLNGGTLSGAVITGGFTILSVTSTTIVYQLSHANASATSNGFAFQQGNISTSCAPLASITSDQAGLTPITQPGLVSNNLGNFSFYAAAAPYTLQYNGSGVVVQLQPIAVPVSTANNNSFTGAITVGKLNGICIVDGVANPTLAAAVTCAGPSGVIEVPMFAVPTLTANVTIPAGVVLQIDGPSCINTTGFILTVNGFIKAGDYNIFCGTGTVTLGLNAVSSGVRSTWFSGGDGGARINAADTSFASTPGKILVTQAGGTTWTTAVTITAQHSVQIDCGFYNTAQINIGSSGTPQNSASFSGCPQSPPFAASSTATTTLFQANGTNSATAYLNLSGSYVLLRDLVIDGNGANNLTSGPNIFFLGSNHSIQSVLSRNSHSHGLQLGNGASPLRGTGTVMQDFYSNNNTGSGILANWTTDLFLSSGVVLDNNGRYGFECTGCSGVHIAPASDLSGNVLGGALFSGTAAFNSGLSEIMGVIFKNNTGIDLDLESDAGGTAHCGGFKIVGNTFGGLCGSGASCTSGSSAAANTFDAIKSNGCGLSTIGLNVIEKSSASPTYKYGIEIAEPTPGQALVDVIGLNQCAAVLGGGTPIGTSCLGQNATTAPYFDANNLNGIVGQAGFREFVETSCPGAVAGQDILCGSFSSPASHQLASSNNGIAFFPVPQTGNVSGTHSDSGFYQTAGAAGCTTAASIGGVCATAITITWPVAFQDANYKVTCTPIGPATNLPSNPYVVTPIAASVTINYFAITAAAASWPTVNCEAVHN